MKIKEPNTIDDALNSDHSQEWKKAANIEYSSLIENQTWSLVKLPKGHNVVGCKWVFRVKYDGNGELKCFKGRLVAQGFSQKYDPPMQNAGLGNNVCHEYLPAVLAINFTVRDILPVVQY